jgi:hypothetical protein
VRVRQTLEPAVRGGHLARFLRPRASLAVRVRQAVQVPVARRLLAHVHGPRETEPLGQLHTFQVTVERRVRDQRRRPRITTMFRCCEVRRREKIQFKKKNNQRFHRPRHVSFLISLSHFNYHWPRR